MWSWRPNCWPTRFRKIEDLSRRVQRSIEQVLGLSVKLRLMEPGSIERSEGKSKHVVDKRKLYD